MLLDVAKHTHFVGMFYGPGFCWLLRQRRKINANKHINRSLFRLCFFCVSNWWGQFHVFFFKPYFPAWDFFSFSEKKCPET